jgi:Na+-transporting NADH:ubiquinone oxidoreductase subunit A
MKTNISILLVLFSFFWVPVGSFAQNNTSGGNSGALVLALLGLAVFILLVWLADGLQSAKPKGILANLSKGSAPDYAKGFQFFNLKKGHQIRLKGGAEKEMLKDSRITTYAVQPTNFIGLSPIPKMNVEVGQEVKAGDSLFFDKKQPKIQFCAPVSGEVVAVNRGEKRAITEVVILADKDIQHRDLGQIDVEAASREEIVTYMADHGLWPLIQERPFQVMPDLDTVPRDIFISTFDTAPLAPDLDFVVDGKEKAFQNGLDVLGKLTSGQVYLGLDANGKKAPSKTFTEALGVQKVYFKGNHPAGNVGVQIHHIAPIQSGEKVWTVGVQEVINIGQTFLKGQLDLSRVVAITGSEVDDTGYIATYVGANIGDLVKGNLEDDHTVRLISGDVLSGSQKVEAAFLDFHDDQITVVKEGDYHEMFGWLVPDKARPTVSRSFLSYFTAGKKKFEADTNTHGEERAFVVTGQYEHLLPMDIYPQHLLKSILTGDLERMEGLGINEIVEEDIALCEFACTSKQPLQHILRSGLDMMREQL